MPLTSSKTSRHLTSGKPSRLTSLPLETVGEMSSNLSAFVELMPTHELVSETKFVSQKDVKDVNQICRGAQYEAAGGTKTEQG